MVCLCEGGNMGIEQKKLSNTICNLYLSTLRDGLTDPTNKSRKKDEWIRSSLLVSTPAPGTDNSTNGMGAKRSLAKISELPGFPQIVVGNFQRTSRRKYIKGNKLIYYYEATLDIRIVDVGEEQRVDALCDAVCDVLDTKHSTLIAGGCNNIEYDVISTSPFEMDSNLYNEKNILLTFTVRVK